MADRRQFQRDVLRIAAIFLSVFLVACSGGTGGGSSAVAFQPAQAVGLFVVAGNTGGRGYADGIATSARFNSALGMASDSAGNLYVADTGNHTIRKITPAGVVTTLTGTVNVAGSADGNGIAAQFKEPSALALDASGNIYVADTGNHTIRKIAPNGAVTTVAGAAGQYGSTDGVGAAARFSSPSGLAVDGAGNIYVIEYGNYAARKIASDGTVSTLAGSVEYGFLAYSTGDGVGPDARFLRPAAIVLNKDGNLYIADGFALRKVTTAGVVTTLSGSVELGGRVDGQGPDARFNAPTAIVNDAAGNLFVFDEGYIRKVTLSGVTTTIVQRPDLFQLARYSRARVGMTAGTDGNIYVSWLAIKRVTPAGDVATFAGDPGSVGGVADGSGEVAQFVVPSAITTDGSGNLYLIDGLNDYGQEGSVLRKISVTDTVTTLTSATDRTLHTALTSDMAGNLYFATAAWTFCDCSTTVGFDSIGRRSATGDARTLLTQGASGLALDASNNLYFSTSGAVHRLSTSGAITDVVTGLPLSPSALASATDGTVYFVYGNSVRKIAADGTMTTLAGDPDQPGSADGSGITARFNQPQSVTSDPAGNVYVADTGNHTIRKIAANGIVTTVAGKPGKIGIVTGALPGSLDMPRGVVYAGANTLYVTTGKSVLKLMLPAGA